MAKSAVNRKKMSVPEVPWDDEPLTPADERAVEEGRRAIREGKFVSLKQIDHDLDRRRRRSRTKKS